MCNAVSKIKLSAPACIDHIKESDPKTIGQWKGRRRCRVERRGYTYMRADEYREIIEHRALEVKTVDTRVRTRRARHGMATHRERSLYTLHCASKQNRLDQTRSAFKRACPRSGEMIWLGKNWNPPSDLLNALYECREYVSTGKAYKESAPWRGNPPGAYTIHEHNKRLGRMRLAYQRAWRRLGQLSWVQKTWKGRLGPLEFRIWMPRILCCLSKLGVSLSMRSRSKEFVPVSAQGEYAAPCQPTGSADCTPPHASKNLGLIGRDEPCNETGQELEKYFGSKNLERPPRTSWMPVLKAENMLANQSRGLPADALDVKTIGTRERTRKARDGAATHRERRLYSPIVREK